MTDTLSRLAGPTSLSAGTSTVFTGTAAHVYTIRNIVIANPTGAAITVKLGIGGVADANLILPAASIEAGGMAVFNGIETLTGTETFVANTSALGLTITVSGLDQA